VFDLDGTLADTTQDLCYSVNATLDQLGTQRLPDRVIAGFVGNGVPMLPRRALARLNGTSVDDVREAVLNPMYDFFLNYYLQHAADYTTLYPDVEKSLRLLREASSRAAGILAVLTNNPVRPAKHIMDRLGVAPCFQRRRKLSREQARSERSSFAHGRETRPA
jgi:phosphoglycolate phosphatase